MERRVFVAILLCFAVLYGYQALFVPPPPATTIEGPAAGVTPPAPATPQAPAPDSTPAAAPAAAGAAPVTTETTEREIVVQTAAVEAVLTNRGGRLLHWRLKEYKDAQGTPVDLIPTDVPDTEPRPFALQVDDAALTTQLNSAIYRVTGDTNGRVDATGEAAAVVFEFEDAAGVRARKEFRFDPSNYVVTFSAAVSAAGKDLNPRVAWGPGLGDIGAISSGGSFFTGNLVQPPRAIYHRDGSVERITSSDVNEQPVHEGQFRFAGVDDHYFLSAAVDTGQARLEYRPLTLPGPDDTRREFLAETIQFAQAPQNVRYFIGPKQFDLLQSVDSELVRAIDFGIFGFLTVPLLSALKWLYGYVGNYGWSIVILTVIINIVMFPLKHKSVVSMRRMQQLQPQLKSIQERYAKMKLTDPGRSKMNEEMMALYRKEGVNPASGCVPMLLTMPVLFAFYSMLSVAVEIRGEPWALWIKDLSQHDPYYITPVMMGASMLWQQRMTPVADPAQQKIMMLTPIMFLVFFLWAPSGLVIYWLMSNLIGIGQQYATNRIIGKPIVRTPRPAAERKVKQAGSGQSDSARGNVP